VATKMATDSPKVRVGVGVFVLKANPESGDNPVFLVGKRRGSHGAGTWALPGGHLEFGETFEQCAAREVDEETGLGIQNIRYLSATNDIMKKDNKHYITVFMMCERAEEARSPAIREPEKCERWEWWTWDQLLEYAKKAEEAEEGHVLETTLFIPFLNLLKQHPGVRPTQC